MFADISQVNYLLESQTIDDAGALFANIKIVH